MDTALPQKFPFILDRNLAKANCTENWVCTYCDIVVLANKKNYYTFFIFMHSVDRKQNIEKITTRCECL